jgi:hypothetical protein
LLLRYVFGPEVMDADRLWGAAAVYLMVGILWCFIYGLTMIAGDAAFLVRGDPRAPPGTDRPALFQFLDADHHRLRRHRPCHACRAEWPIIEGIFGTLFLAILIAKLVGVYPPPVRERHRNHRRPKGDLVKPTATSTEPYCRCCSSRVARGQPVDDVAVSRRPDLGRNGGHCHLAAVSERAREDR